MRISTLTQRVHSARRTQHIIQLHIVSIQPANKAAEHLIRERENDVGGERERERERESTNKQETLNGRDLEQLLE